MKLGSFFDGIGGWLLAAKHAGVKPVWASEIDDFPAAVTARHFLDVVQLGDITKIDVDTLEPVDIICAGSPCQDLSVAGKREGLKGARSGLFRTAIDLVHGLRKRTGCPRFFVWENVPGAFSSNKGLDFRAVLEEITTGEIPMPKDGRWAESGYVEWGGTSSLAWRTLDAQYWGVPQRRKRIFLVADFAGHSAGEILFESESLSGDSAESQGEGQEAAANIGASIDSANICWAMNQPSNRINDYSTKTISPTLTARMGTGGNQVPIVHCLNDQGGKFMNVTENKSGTLRAEEHGHHPIVVGFYPQMKAESMTSMVEKSPCLVNGTNPGWQNGVFWDGGQVCSTLTSHNADGSQRMPDKKHFNAVIDKVGTLNCMHDQQCVMTVQKTVNVESWRQTNVRRLTPLEAERLQGLPDGYTDIEFNGKPAPDSRRYKALGNGMAQPCADFVIKRIVQVIEGKE